MQNGVFESFALVDLSGQLIILAIVVCFVLAVVINGVVRVRYVALEKALEHPFVGAGSISHPVLARLTHEARSAPRREGQDVNVQALVEQVFGSAFQGALLGERFVRASTGLVIILGLVGTFYGLTLSIGKLVTLVAVDSSNITDLTGAMVHGLSEALSGMSVAFTTSLVGIVAAIVLTLIGVVSSLADRRGGLLVSAERFVDQVLASETLGGSGSADRDERLAAVVGDFGASVTQLDGAVQRFETALQTFATTTRDFNEFNLHLKDNIQRMSLSFGDFSDSLKSQVNALKGRPPAR